MPVLDRTLLDQFEEQGYLIVENVLDRETEMRPVIAEYEEALDALCERLQRQGDLPDTYRDLPFGERLSRILNEAGQSYYEHFDITLAGAITEETPIHLGPAVFNILTSPRLLDIIEQIIGPEIYSNPIQHVRIKPPEHFVPAHHRNSLTAVTDWHQDQGVALPEADQSTILTVWIAITDATVQNGCLKLVPGSHRGDLALHCPASSTKNQAHIPDQFVPEERAIPAEVGSGGTVFMHRRTMHAALPNVSDDIRWSFDLRYNPIGQPTGRPWFPGFAARGRQHPDEVISDWRVWADLWRAARSRLAREERPSAYRWDGSSPACA